MDPCNKISDSPHLSGETEKNEGSDEAVEIFRTPEDPIETKPNKNFDPFYVKGFIQLTSQRFVVIMDGVEIEECPCNDRRVFLNKVAKCPVVSREKKGEITATGVEIGLSDRDFPILYNCSIPAAR